MVQGKDLFLHEDPDQQDCGFRKGGTCTFSCRHRETETETETKLKFYERFARETLSMMFG